VKEMSLNNPDFGRLVKAYRGQRGWTQEQLAERWGHTREYVSQIERGKSKLDSVAQVVRLADILDIPQERLESIGRGIPQRKIEVSSPKEADDAILQMLLNQSRDKAKLTYVAWIADQQPTIEEDLRETSIKLEKALTSYRGEFVKPAQQLLAYNHMMQGRIVYDRLDFAASNGHYSEMIDIGQELNDADIITIGMVRQGSILRKRGRYESALRCFEAAKSFAEVAAPNVQGARLVHIATAYADMGDEQQFYRYSSLALDIASDIQPDISSLANEFSVDEVLISQATGFSAVWKPEKALEIYRETDRLRPFRPLRDHGRYMIEKGQAHLYAGDLDEGINLSLKGLKQAEEYKSKRHIGWIDTAYNRVKMLPIGVDKRLKSLREALREAHQKQDKW
jgi:transcriptional regulator with XRE-family HTH domain